MGAFASYTTLSPPSVKPSFAPRTNVVFSPPQEYTTVQASHGAGAALSPHMEYVKYVQSPVIQVSIRCLITHPLGGIHTRWVVYCSICTR